MHTYWEMFIKYSLNVQGVAEAFKLTRPYGPLRPGWRQLFPVLPPHHCGHEWGPISCGVQGFPRGLRGTGTEGKSMGPRRRYWGTRACYEDAALLLFPETQREWLLMEVWNIVWLYSTAICWKQPKLTTKQPFWWAFMASSELNKDSP